MKHWVSMHSKVFKHKTIDIKKKILDIAYTSGRAHLGGIFSVLEILVALKYQFPFIEIFLGKGHAALGLYVILNDLGKLTNDELESYCKNGSKFGIQLFPGIAENRLLTGSLGNVIGIATGVSIANKLNNDEKLVCAIIGDGECEEGSVWESIDFIVKNQIKNVLIIVDRNRLSVMREFENDRLEEKILGFGIPCKVIDGHNFEEIITTIEDVSITGISCVLLCDTIKGKGISFMENDVKWHHGHLTEELYQQAKLELDGFTG